MGGRGDRSHLAGIKDRGGVGRCEDTNVGGATCRT